MSGAMFCARYISHQHVSHVHSVDCSKGKAQRSSVDERRRSHAVREPRVQPSIASNALRSPCRGCSGTYILIFNEMK
jgi:hypothetical protein